MSMCLNKKCAELSAVVNAKQFQLVTMLSTNETKEKHFNDSLFYELYRKEYINNLEG